MTRRVSIRSRLGGRRNTNGHQVQSLSSREFASRSSLADSRRYCPKHTGLAGEPVNVRRIAVNLAAARISGWEHRSTEAKWDAVPAIWWWWLPVHRVGSGARPLVDSRAKE